MPRVDQILLLYSQFEFEVGGECVVLGHLPGSLPRRPPGHLLRERLQQRLLAQDYRLRLLVAPAGFGKSVLLADCARACPPGQAPIWFNCGGRAWSAAEFCRHYNNGVFEAIADTLQPAEFYHSAGYPCGCPIMATAGLTPLNFQRYLRDYEKGVAEREWSRFVPQTL